MSVTTTENRVYYTLQQTLQDYEVHHSNQLSHHEQSQNPHPESRAASNPASWPTNHRNVPSYRPINRDLDFSERGARNTAEAIFAFTMLNGVWINAVRSTLLSKKHHWS